VSRRLLLVEDDPRIRSMLRLALSDEGYDVTEAATGGAGLEGVADASPDVVLLDLILPDMDGFEVCRRIRRTSDVPVVMVTARADSHDVVAGLEAGADDYVTKPVVAKELSARIRALLRRTEGRRGESERVLAVGDLEVHPDSGVVRLGERPLHLTKTEFRLLCELAASPGRIFSRAELLKRVWEYDYLGDGRLVDVHVRRLRSKIEDDPAEPRRLVTVRGLGYKLES
jgi:DNA-binding response OmpR family regulator